MVALIVVIAFFALAAGLVCEHVLPWRRAHRHRAALVESLGAELGLVPVEIKRDGTTLLRGLFNDRAVDIDISNRGCAIVKVNLSTPAVPHDLRIYETSSWGYQKMENRMLGLTVDTGDPRVRRRVRPQRRRRESCDAATCPHSQHVGRASSARAHDL